MNKRSINDTISSPLSFYSRKDAAMLCLGFIMFFLVLVIPAHRGYFTYASDSRTTYENQGFQLLDSLHAGQLPLWDPYNANGRDGTCLSVGTGTFAPDLVSASWIVGKLFPGLRTIDKSFLVNFIFRYFLIFGLGVWFLGTLFLRSRTSLYFFFGVLTFGTPIFLPLNNQVLSQTLSYFPWALFFLLSFVTTRTLMPLVGFILALATIFMGLGRDFPLLLYACLIACVVAAPVFWRSLFKLRFHSFSKKEWLMALIASCALLVIVVSMKSLGEDFLSFFTKLRYTGIGRVDLPLSAAIPDIGFRMLRVLPNAKSLLFPFPAVAYRFGHYHKAHSYLFLGLSGITLFLFSFRTKGEPKHALFRNFFFALIVLYFASAYRESFPLYSFAKKFIPGVKMYQYVFHLKYFMLLGIVALSSIGLDNMLIGVKWQKITTIALSMLFTGAAFILAKQVMRRPPPLLAAGMYIIIIGRLVQGFLLTRVKDDRIHRGWNRAFVASEVFVAIFFLCTGHVAAESGWEPIRADRMYFLKYRLSNFTLHAVPTRERNLSLGTIYKVNFAKDEHLRMNGQAYLYKVLPPRQAQEILGADAPRLFLAKTVTRRPANMLSSSLRQPDYPSLREVPVILDDGYLPKTIPLYRPAALLPEQETARIRQRIDIPRSAMSVRSVKNKDGWSIISVEGMGFSRHLSTNPYIMKQENITCTLNGKRLSGNWLMEDITHSSKAVFELNKDVADRLTVFAPVEEGAIRSLTLEFRDSGGIHINDFNYNHLDLTYTADGQRVLVYMDSFAYGWRAAVDGIPASIMRAYGAYKAVLVPEGTHRVTFSYRPEKIILAWRSAFTAYAILVLMLISVLFVNHRNKKGRTDNG